jgi:hypothetical protein
MVSQGNLSVKVLFCPDFFRRRRTVSQHPKNQNLGAALYSSSSSGWCAIASTFVNCGIGGLIIGGRGGIGGNGRF